MVNTQKNNNSKIDELSQNLEREIARNLELTARIKELEQLNRVMIDRELKMMELKREINDLRDKQRNCVNP